VKLPPAISQSVKTIVLSIPTPENRARVGKRQISIMVAECTNIQIRFCFFVASFFNSLSYFRNILFFQPLPPIRCLPSAAFMVRRERKEINNKRYTT